MKRSFYKTLVFILVLLLWCIQESSAYVCKFKEDYYKLYHVHHQQQNDDVIENIFWLEQAVKSDFANPMHAFAKIEDEKDWEKYRYLFQMHINLKLIEQHLRLGRVYDKKVAHFYDAPWKDEYLRNLEKAKTCYEACYIYWQEAMLWAEKANEGKFRFMNMSEIQNWEDERERIFTGKLNYKKTLDRELTRLNKVIETFKEMGESY